MGKKPNEKKIRSRCGANFGAAVKSFNESLNGDPAIVFENIKLKPLENAEFVSFAGFQFEPGGIRSGFKVKPDAIYIDSAHKTGNSIAAIAFEHCGSWQNFYQKRFLYLPKTLGLFQTSYLKLKSGKPKRPPVYKQIATLDIKRIIYLLPDDQFYRRIVCATPQHKHEYFSFCYGKWEKMKANFSPEAEASNSISWADVKAQK